MAIELRINGAVAPGRPRRHPRVDDAASVEELLGWAVFLDRAGTSTHADLREARALVEAAGSNIELLHQAWLLGLDRLGDGVSTTGVIDLLHSAVDVLDPVRAA